MAAYKFEYPITYEVEAENEEEAFVKITDWMRWHWVEFLEDGKLEEVTNMEYMKGDEILQRKDCGCLIFQRMSGMYGEPYETRQDIHYCPKHKAALEMYEALQEIVFEGTRCLDVAREDKPAIYNISEVDKIARQALAKAEVK